MRRGVLILVACLCLAGCADAAAPSGQLGVLKLPTPDSEPAEEGPERMGWRFADRTFEAPDDTELKQWLTGVRRRFARAGPPPDDAPDPTKKGFLEADTELGG